MLLGIKGEIYKVKLLNKLINFQSTLVKPFYKNNNKNLNLENNSLSKSLEPFIYYFTYIKTIKNFINNTNSLNTLFIIIPINKSKL